MERISQALQAGGFWRYAIALSMAFAALAAIAAHGIAQGRQSAAARDFVLHSLAVQEDIHAFELANAAMEIHQRNFLLTGQRGELPARDGAHAAAVRALRRLQGRLSGTLVQGARARALGQALQRRHARMSAVARLGLARGMDAARSALALHGPGSPDDVLASLDALRAEQQRLLADSSQRAGEQAARFHAVLVYGAGLALLVVAATAVLMLRQLSRNARLARELVALHRLQAAEARELARSNRELEAFTYTISHDLRAPLRHVDGYARMLQEDAGDLLGPELQRYVDTIRDSSRRMGALIDDLLAYARLGRQPIQRVRVDMGELTARVLAEAGADAFPGRLETGPLPQALADPVLLRQAWMNLLSNAFKYSAVRGAEARVEVSGEQSGTTTRYRIRDNGVGFDMRYADKLFGVFQRLHSQDEFEGTGVGLAIVGQVVERHGGRVSVEAVPGKGACFTVELPGEAA